MKLIIFFVLYKNKFNLFRYTLLAQDLAAAARGNPVDNCRWRLSSGGSVSFDDITVFVIPLKFAINVTAYDVDDDEELLNVI